MLKIISNQNYISERRYVSHVIFKEFLGMEFELEFKYIVNGLIIEWQDKQITFPDTLFSTESSQWLKPSSCPSQPLPVISFNYEGLYNRDIPALYSDIASEQTYSCPIDIFGSIFFLLTRYEEINAPLDDQFERYDFKNSILFREDLLERPLVNEYLDLLKTLLKQLIPAIKFKTRKFDLRLSHDVDVPITYSAGWRDTIKKSIGDLAYRKSICLFSKRLCGKFIHSLNGSLALDPNNNLSFLMDSADSVGIKSVFNFIPQPGRAFVDSTYHLTNPHIIQQLSSIFERGFEVGFHPSFQSFNNFEQTAQELEMLNTALDSLGIPRVRIGRQHFLRWSNPVTWQIWDELGLDKDCSLGYDGINGFRSGCCYEYSVFNLRTRKHLRLKEQPLILMDNNSSIHNSFRINEDARRFSSIVRFFGGDLSLLIHNNYILSGRQRRNFQNLLKQNV